MFDLTFQDSQLCWCQWGLGLAMLCWALLPTDTLSLEVPSPRDGHSQLLYEDGVLRCAVNPGPDSFIYPDVWTNVDLKTVIIKEALLLLLSF